MDEFIDYIKNLLGSMDDGRISISPYDTAWIALIRDLKGRNIPQFPSSLEWISSNQLPDGSWGDKSFFLAYDRLLNTLACVVALRSWNVFPEKSEKGISFIKENISKLGDANAQNMTCGFEIVFPALLQRAKELGIDGIPYDAPVLQGICAVRDRKLGRMPKELLHEVPTCLLYNLEGLGDLEWPKILKLQTPKGSFLTSPAASSLAVMETKDENCFKFIEYIVNKFNGGAPPVYPVDMFTRAWAVDRLQRLGISRFFDQEIRKCLDHIYSYWTEKGVFSARESEFVDVDDTAMCFRILRLYGYNVSPDALANFKKDNEFTCYVGQSFESPSPIFNLFRASQVLFPGEIILEEAREFSHHFLQEKLEKNQLLDKWLISKHLPHEITNGLEMPWYASLPRIEACFYIENYSVDDVWIGKSLYRMQEINNEAYLELAKLDYNRCQAQHQIEWDHMQKWYEDFNLQEFGISKRDLLLTFFLATASIFEPERSGARLAWIKSQVVCNILTTNCFIKEGEFLEQWNQLSTEFGNNQRRKWGWSNKNIHKSITIMFETLQELAKDAHEHIGRDVSGLLLDAWDAWLKKPGQGDEEFGQVGLLIQTINICGGHVVSRDMLSHDEYRTLSRLLHKIITKLDNGNEKIMGMEYWKKTKQMSSKYQEIEKDMQLLVQLVLQDSSNGILSRDIKQTFFAVAKTFYYRALFTSEQIENHASRVLFEPVV
ncbi:Copal-8-ol diphosphate hydratase [Handroanthus impetiginosus]|uniref:Copal-8-ol diphosphate hydratase n=1 Tax=Handroanthus impetiginosus TaxID=429701 RepID=A0A2G9GCJ4_9LAMI|nr:Copal-8-ol diphosphate hydratase [Handroanthus impetiginosus]